MSPEKFEQFQKDLTKFDERMDVVAKKIKEILYPSVDVKYFVYDYHDFDMPLLSQVHIIGVVEDGRNVYFGVLSDCIYDDEAFDKEFEGAEPIDLDELYADVE